MLQFQTDESAAVSKDAKLIRPGFRQIVAGLRPFYEPAQLVGRSFVILANLKNEKFKGQTSEGMLLTAVKGSTKGLLTVDEKEAEAFGARIVPGLAAVPRDCVATFKPNYDVKKNLSKLDLMTRGAAGVVCFGNSELLVDIGGGQTVTIVGDKAGEGAKLQ